MRTHRHARPIERIALTRMNRNKPAEIISGEKILVFAPHNDDEILATGGVIQRYVKSGTPVRIALMTNGDGQVRRPSILPFAPRDFVKLGYRRQSETLNALSYLGLGEKDVEFFGYPDRGLNRMWTVNWNSDNLYYSKYTRSRHSSYENSYSKGTPHCGTAVVEDVKRLMLEVKPQVVYLPHPNDLHPDHRATNGFVLYGLEQLKNEGRDEFESVRMLSYLVHSMKYPNPRGKVLHAPMTIPPHLKVLDTEWVDVALEEEERKRKFRGITIYKTQTRIMRRYLFSFARANELFGLVPGLKLDDSTHYDATLNISREAVGEENHDEPFLSYIDPKRKSRLAALKRYPEIKSVTLSKTAGRLNIAVKFFKEYRPGNDIHVNIKPFIAGRTGTGTSHDYMFRGNKLYHNEAGIPDTGDYGFESGRHSYWLSIPIKDIGSPCKLILSLTLARKDVPLAMGANRLVKI